MEARARPTDCTFSSVLDAAGEATGLLQAGWQGDEDQLGAGAARLAGLGSGLTPSGDDFLTGVMTWAWLDHPDPPALCHSLLDASALRTTTLSAALLGAAARGECSAAWQVLLAALAQGSDSDLDAAVRDVLSVGATSGAATFVIGDGKMEVKEGKDPEASAVVKMTDIALRKLIEGKIDALTGMNSGMIQVEGSEADVAMFGESMG